MLINLDLLKPLQKKLDEKILLNHNITSKKTILERILAFQVELGELANETRCFKYWSLKEASEESVILEEYVDGIHFLVSLSLEFDFDLVFNIESVDKSKTKQFLDVFVASSNLEKNFSSESLIKLFKEYLILGVLLGFNNENIINAYIDKNKTNHIRQENNY